MALVNASFWRGRRVLVTGHTGFKGSWMALWLRALGAEVTGLSDGIPTEPSLYELAKVARDIEDRRADVRDYDAVAAIAAEAKPEVVFHMAAQSLVRRSYEDPVVTYATNVLGSVHVIEAARAAEAAAIINVTSDKCYENSDSGRAFTEDDPMGGHDPYSSSKGCAELVTAALRDSFDLPLASGRAGNVIGGGDWSVDRLVPDIMRAAMADGVLSIRRSDAVRPWQHVLNPLSGYLVLAEHLFDSAEFRGGWNFGPAATDARTVGWVVGQIAEQWPRPIRIESDGGANPAEARHLALDSSKAGAELDWHPVWDLRQGLDRTIEWYLAFERGDDVRELTLRQLDAFLDAAE